MKLLFITPSRNCRNNIKRVVQSIDTQDDDRWLHYIIDDASDEGRDIRESDINIDDDRRTFIRNTERKYALRNIIDVSRAFQDRDDIIIGTVDGDDHVISQELVRTILNVYSESPNVDVVWTAHEWDVDRNMNVSRPMPQNVDPYDYVWCASHFRTFRASLLKQVSDDNFKDLDGVWFKRGYDQALMLPMLYVGRGRRYIDKVMYSYNIDSESIPLSERYGTEIEQINNIALIRARGFVR